MRNMQAINMSAYANQGLFLHNVEGYDCVVFESLENESLIADVAEKNITIKTLDDVSMDFSLNGKLQALTDEHKQVIVVLNTLPLLYLLPVMQYANNITVLHTQPGSTSLLHGVQIHRDLDYVLASGVSAYEPYDMMNFFQIMKENKAKLVRMPNKDMTTKVFEAEQALNPILDLRPLGLAGGAATILTGAALLGDAAQAVQVLRDEVGTGYDLFGWVDYTTPLSSEIKESLLQTDRLIVIIDDTSKQIASHIKAALWSAGLYEVSLTILGPQHENLQTLEQEFLWEQVGLDAQSIADRLQELE